MKERILFLTIKKKWFDLIKSGQKKFEYRTIKPWSTKLLSKEYDYVLFQNGYRKDSPRVKVEYLGWEIQHIKNELFDDSVPVYAIKLGNVISSV